MACFGIVWFVSCVLTSLFQQAVAPPPPIIEAYKPTSEEPRSFQEKNSGSGSLEDLSKMLTKLQHKIDDINVRRQIMEAQMKSPFGLSPRRVEAALDYTYAGIPSTVYHDRKIVSASGVFLQIFPDGTANGTRDDSSPYTNITVEMVGVGETVKIMVKGKLSKKYLTCSKNGKRFQAVTKKSLNGVFLIPQPPKPKLLAKVNKDGTKKLSQRSLFWLTKKYMNLKCEKYGWFLAFRHNDQLKKGRHSRGKKLDSWFMFDYDD